MYPHVVHAGPPTYTGQDMKELGRDNDTLSKNYACDCCGLWLPKGTEVQLVAYAASRGKLFDNIAETMEGTGASYHYQWYCFDCVGVRV